jgi:hypothetical protein
MQTRVEDGKDMALVKIQGVLVDVLVEMAPETHKSCVSRDKKGLKQLLAQCQKAPHGAVVASLLHCRKFVKSLTDIGFVLNPHDPCVANKIVNELSSSLSASMLTIVNSAIASQRSWIE